LGRNSDADSAQFSHHYATSFLASQLSKSNQNVGMAAALPLDAMAKNVLLNENCCMEWLKRLVKPYIVKPLRELATPGFRWRAR
jgi:hypothetical protein